MDGASRSFVGREGLSSNRGALFGLKRRLEGAFWLVRDFFVCEGLLVFGSFMAVRVPFCMRRAFFGEGL